ncbi:MAG: DMT family transporter [Hyphomicrobiaceae bacterium]
MLSAAAPLLFVLIWSSGFVAAKLAVPFAEPCTFLALRFALVVMLAAPLALWERRTWSSRPWLLAHAAVAGAAMQGVYLSCVVWSIYLGMPAGIVALVVCLHPITTALLASIFLGERITPLGWLGFVIGLAGAALVLWPWLDLASSGIRPATFALALAALPAMSGGTIYQKRHTAGLGVGSATFAQHAGGLAVVTLAAFALETRVVDWTPVLIGSLAWQAIAVSGGAVALLLYMLQGRGASGVGSVFYLVPAGVAAMTYAALGERLELVQLAGVAVVTAAVALIASNIRAGPAAPHPPGSHGRDAATGPMT